MNNYSTQNEIMSMTDFQRDTKCSFLKIPRWVSETHFKLKGKDYRLSLHEVCILSTIMDYMQLSIQNKRYQDEFGPFCTISYNTLQEKLNISEYHVKTSLRNLKEIGLIATKKRDAGSSNRTYLTKMCVALETVATTDSGDGHQNTRAIGLKGFRHSSPTSNTDNNKTEYNKTKLLNTYVNKAHLTEIDGEDDKTQSVSGPSAPTRADTGGTLGTEQNVDDQDILDKAECLPRQGEGFSHGLSNTTSPTVGPTCSYMGQINSAFDYDEFKIIVNNLMEESSCECTDVLCQDVIDTIVKMSQDNGYRELSLKYLMNPEVISVALTRCGVDHSSVYKGLYYLRGCQPDFRGELELAFCR